jgi:arylsulfatase A-like enzyme
VDAAPAGARVAGDWFGNAVVLTLLLIAAGAAVIVLAVEWRRRSRRPGASMAWTSALGRRDVLLLAIPMGVLSGIIEAILRIVELDFRHIPSGTFAIPEVFWAAPAAATAGFLGVGLVFLALDAVLGRWIPMKALAFPAYVCLTVVGIALSIRLGIRGVAPWILGLGVAVAVTRAVAASPAAFTRFVRLTGPWVAATFLVYAIAVPIVRHFMEHRAIAALPAARPGAPNVLIVIWDAARAMSSSLYGGKRPTTPELEAIARRGTTFDRAFSTAPWTLPSHASIWTGRYPHELSAGYRTPLDDTYATMGEVLAQNGYVTGGFMGNAFFGMPAFGLSRGFQTYHAGRRIDLTFVATSWSFSNYFFQRARWARGLRRNPLLRTAEQVNQDMLEWVDRRGNRPYFAVLNYFDTHDPYFPPMPYRAAFSKEQGRYWLPEELRPFPPQQLGQLRAAYEEAMLYVDHETGALRRTLEQRGDLENTVVIITADHGEAFGEHDASVTGHGVTLFTPMLHVPLVISFPSRLPSGVRRTETVSLRDIPATVMDLLGVQRHPFPGISLVKYATGTASPAEVATPRLALTERTFRESDGPKWAAVHGDMFSVLEGPMHYIVDAEEVEHLYNLDQDPIELTDLSGDTASKPLIEKLRRVLDSAVARPDGARYARFGQTEGDERRGKAGTPPVSTKWR